MTENTRQKKRELKVPEYAYTIKDSVGGEINIQHTDSGWWKDGTLVRQLIVAFKRGYSERRAALRIGLSRQQVRNFLEVHPDFQSKVEDFQEMFLVNIIDKIGDAVDRGDMQTVRWAAERKIPEEYGQKERAPLVVIPITMRGVGETYRPVIDMKKKDEVAGA